MGNADIPLEISRILPRLHDEDSAIREQALWDLSLVNEHHDLAVAQIARMLNDKSRSVRCAAAVVIGELAVYHSDSLESTDENEIKLALISVEPLLIERLRDADEQPDVRAAAARALGYMGLDAETTVPLLSGLFEDKNEEPDVRIAAAAALGGIGPEAKPAVRALIEGLADDDERIRQAACYALGRIGSEAGETVPRLAERLHDESPKVRAAALDALNAFGERASDAWPVMMELVNDPEAEVRASLASALWYPSIANPEKTIELLTVLANDSDPTVRSIADLILDLLFPDQQKGTF